MNNMGILIEDINLTDAPGWTGGKAWDGETLADFIAENLRPGRITTLADINKDLEACGIEPITPEQIVVIGNHWEDDDYEER